MCQRCKKLPPDSKCPAMAALEKLTPGGSEFWEDPEFCYLHIKRKIDGLFQTAKNAIIAKKKLQSAKERVTEVEVRSPKKLGSVCARCGRTVTEEEYSSGEPVCCGDFVIAEEAYK